MSAKGRAFSKLDRESLQDAIEARNSWATEWVQRREGKRAYLDSAMDLDLIDEAGEALMILSRRLDHLTQEDSVKVLWDLIDALSVWDRILERPVNVKLAVELITNDLNSGLDKLALAGVWTRRSIEH